LFYQDHSDQTILSKEAIGQTESGLVSIDLILSKASTRMETLLKDIEDGRLTNEMLAELDLIAERYKQTIQVLNQVN
jgi:ketol-acid reductoisomerase